MTEPDPRDVREEARKALSDHEIECERRYGEIRTKLAKMEIGLQRNTTLMRVILGVQVIGMGGVTLAAKLI